MYIFLPHKMVYSAHRIIIIISLFIHFLSLFLIGFTSGRLPLSSVAEVLSVLAFFLALFYIMYELRVKKKAPGFILLPLICIFQLIPVFYTTKSQLDNSILNLPVLFVHVISNVSGYAFIFFSMILSVLYLNLNVEMKKHHVNTITENTPSLEIMNRINSIFHVCVLILLGVGITLGVWLSILIWGNLPFLDPKIIISLVLWLYYLASLGIRYGFKLGGKMMSILWIIGFIIMLILFFAVNIFFPSKHNFG